MGGPGRVNEAGIKALADGIATLHAFGETLLWLPSRHVRPARCHVIAGAHLQPRGNSVYGLRRWRNGKDIEKDGDHALARSVRALLLKAWAQSRTTILVERISKGKRVLEKAKQSSAPKGQWETYVITISISLAACGSTANRRHRAM